MIKILLVEDDLGLSNSVFDFLDDFADVMQVFDGEEGLYEAESGVYDLILLDLMLPEKNGFQVLKELREKGISTPVLIMTAKESLDDKGHGFELGADDYLTKPFYLEELKMRIQALLKRSGKFNENTLSYGDLTVNLATNEVKVNETAVELLGKEFDLLVYFLQNQNVILPKTQIFDFICCSINSQLDDILRIATERQKLLINRCVETGVHNLQDNQGHSRENQSKYSKVTDKVAKIFCIPILF